MSGSLKPYFYFVFRASAAANGLQQRVKALCVVLDGEYTCQDFAFRTKEPLNKSSSAGRRIFCPTRAVLKAGNTYSIPPLSELSAETKSSAASSCRFIQSFLTESRGRWKPGRETAGIPITSELGFQTHVSVGAFVQATSVPRACWSLKGRTGAQFEWYREACIFAGPVSRNLRRGLLFV